jgi:hypothetical protein
MSAINNCNCFICQTSKARNLLQVDLITSVTFSNYNLFNNFLLFFRLPFVKKMSADYESLSKDKKKKFIIQNLLNQRLHKHLSDGVFVVKNQNVCFYVWCLVFNWNYKYVLRIGKELKTNLNNDLTISYEHLYDSTMKNIILNFLTEYFDLLAEWDPTGKKALIPKLNKKRMHEELFTNDCVLKNLPVPSYKYFVKVWNNYFSFIRMTNKQRFSICSKCYHSNTLLTQVLEKLTLMFLLTIKYCDDNRQLLYQIKFILFFTKVYT